MIVYLMTSLLGGILGMIAFVYFFKKGQFDDVEDVKYQMFRDEESR